MGGGPRNRGLIYDRQDELFDSRKHLNQLWTQLESHEMVAEDSVSRSQTART